MFALALLCVLVIALCQRVGLLDPLNLGGMRLAGAGRDAVAGSAITLVMRAASLVGDTVGRLSIIAIALFALLWSARYSSARWLTLVMAGGTLLNLGLKQVFAAPRPDILPHLDIVHSYSFPSGHAAGNMMLFGALAMLEGRRWAYVAAGTVIATIGVSRVWLGVHWPSDVLAGWVEGLGWLALCRHWLPAGRGEQQGAAQPMMGRHPIARDETVDPETVKGAYGRDQ